MRFVAPPPGRAGPECKKIEVSTRRIEMAEHTVEVWDKPCTVSAHQESKSVWVAVAKVHSFDVFDTALMRRVAAPSDVFRMLARQIAGEIETENRDEFIEDFFAARMF